VVDPSQSDADFRNRGSAPLAIVVTASTRMVSANPRLAPAPRVGAHVEVIGSAEIGEAANAKQLYANSVRILDVPIAAAAQPDSSDGAQALCSQIDTMKKKPDFMDSPASKDRAKPLADACRRAAAEHRRHAQQIGGAQGDEELLRAADDLFNAAGIDMIAEVRDHGLPELAESRDVFQGVRDRGATPDLRQRGAFGYNAVQNFIHDLATNATPRPAATAAPALAQSLKACNEFKETVFFAFAYRQNGDWASAGWLRVPPSTCRSARLTASYYHAETQAVKLGGDTSENTEWGQGARFCVRTGKFEYAHASSNCGDGRLKDYGGRSGTAITEITIHANSSVTRRTLDI
jgi:uncharacterized membrane protein